MQVNTPIVGAAIGGGASALTQIVLKATVKLDAAKPAADQKVKLFAYRHAGIVGLAVGAVAFGVLYATKRKQAAWGALTGAVVASAPGIVSGVQAAMQQKKLGDGWNPGMGVAVAEPRGLSGAPSVQVFGNSRSDIQLLGTGSGAGGAGAFNAAAFGGGSY